LVVLEREGRIKLGQREHHDYIETTITLQSGLPILDEGEMESIREGVAWVEGKTAKQLSRESHKLSLSWQNSANGELLEIAFDALNVAEIGARETEKKEITQTVEWAKRAVGSMFG